ncbi:hypothetical protein C0993_012492, partial [Termitomyces sp. T159_Od127]
VVEAEILFQGLVHLLGLAVSFQVIGGGEVSLYLKGLTQRLSEPGHKEGATVRYDVVQEFVLGEDVFKEELGRLQGIVGGAAGNENCLLGEVTDDNKDGIEAL